MADFVQTGGTNGSTYASNFSGILSVWENSYDVATNTSNVGYRLQLKSGSAGRFSDYTANYSVTINGTVVKSGSGTYESQSYNTAQTICEGTTTVTHNSDGTKSIDCSAILDFQSGTYSPGDFKPSGNLTLTTIPRYAEINSVSVKSTGLNTAVISYSVSRSANIYCSVDGQNWGNVVAQNTTSGTFTVSGLTPNTKHSFRILARAVASGLDRASDYFYGTTKDIARISSLNDFGHGNDVSVSITNPASISSLKLAIKIGDTQILNRTVSIGTNKITFADTELDNLYKKYGSGSSLTATFVLTGSGYTNTKTCTVTLKGNQKTIQNNVNSEWKRGKLWTNVNGEWKRAVLWINVEGTWKRSI